MYFAIQTYTVKLFMRNTNIAMCIHIVHKMFRHFSNKNPVTSDKILLENKWFCYM